MAVKLPLVAKPPIAPRNGASSRRPPPHGTLLFQPLPPQPKTGSRPGSARTQEAYNRHFSSTIRDAIDGMFPTARLPVKDARFNLTQQCPTMKHLWVGLKYTRTSGVELDLAAFTTDEAGHLTPDNPTLYYGNKGKQTDPIHFREADKKSNSEEDESQTVVMDLYRLSEYGQIVFVVSIQQAVARDHTFSSINTGEVSLVLYEKFNSRARTLATVPLVTPSDGLTGLLTPDATTVEVGAVTRNEEGQWEFVVRGNNFNGTLQEVYKGLTAPGSLTVVEENSRANLSTLVPGIRNLRAGLRWHAMARRGKHKVSVKIMAFCLGHSAVLTEFTNYVHAGNTKAKTGGLILEQNLIDDPTVPFNAQETLAFDLLTLQRNGIKQVVIAIGTDPKGATFGDIADAALHFYTRSGQTQIKELLQLTLPDGRDCYDKNVIELGRLVYLDGSWEVWPTQKFEAGGPGELIKRYRGDFLPLRTLKMVGGDLFNVSKELDDVCKIIRIGLKWGRPKKMPSQSALSRQASTKFRRTDTLDGSASGHTTRAPSTMSFLMDFSPGASKRTSRAQSPPMGAQVANESRKSTVGLLKRSQSSCFSRAGSFSRSSAQIEVGVICHNREGQLISRGMYLYYLNRSTPNGEVKLLDRVEGNDDEVVEIDLEKIKQNPNVAEVSVWLIIYRADERGHNFAHVSKASLRMFNHFSGRELLQLHAEDGHFADGMTTAVCLAKLACPTREAAADAMDEPDDLQWQFEAVMEGHKKSIAELWTTYLPPPIKTLGVGDTCAIPRVDSNSGDLLCMGLGWDLVPSTRQELTQVDVAVLALGADGKLLDEKECAHPANSLTSSGGVILAANSRLPRQGRDDNEVLDIALDKLPDTVHQLMFCFIFPDVKDKRSSWRSVSHMYTRLFNKKVVTKTPTPTHNQTMLTVDPNEKDHFKYPLPLTKIADDVACIEFGRMIRLDPAAVGDDAAHWTFKALFSTRHSGLEDMMRRFKKRPALEVQSKDDLAAATHAAAASMVASLKTK
eukprot:TRINITY_DN63947_c0_g1_i1.p1 TRINITY_DN63947_c0_g1~~TRINITY_DN63947_c0_g1_i1.p1  ORF type:complete len:1016 (-),score=68.38 TRINITY_DN63947_c0_g1_i1:56-3103(-)